MNYFRFIACLLAFAVATASPVAAQWQTQSNSVPIGRGGGATGFDKAAPGVAGVPLTSSGASSKPTFAPVQNAGIAPGAANTAKGTLDGIVTSDIALVSCTAAYQLTKWINGTGWQCGTLPVLPSRAVAATLNLSAFSAVSTLGYAQPGDGGHAVFRNVGTAPFIDSFVTTYSFVGGSGYTNGPYFGVIFSASGRNGFVIGTATVAGGAVTAVNIKGTPGNQCTVGDVYATSSITGGTFSITVTGCSAPLASSSDAVGTHFQYVPDSFPNVLQFGAVGDWDGTDGTATDNFNSIQAASWFAAFKSRTSFDAGGYWGGKVVFPSGSYMAGCNGTQALIVGQSVVFEGPSEVGAQIKLCNTFSAVTDFIEICDPNWHFACFGSKLKNISVFADRNFGVAGGTYVVHSNNVQDFGGLDHVYIYAGQRGCTHFEHGYGGASTVSVQYVSCNGASTNTFMMKFGNTLGSGLAYGSTIFEIQDLVIGGPSSCTPTCQTQPAIHFQGGGFFDVAGVHCENAGQVCITIDIPVTGNGDMVRLHNINSGSGGAALPCTSVIAITAATVVNNTIVGMVPLGSCPLSIAAFNSSNVATPIALDILK